MRDEVLPLLDPTTVLARARGALRNGAVHENELVALFCFDAQGKMAEWTGYLNPLPILRLLGRER